MNGNASKRIRRTRREVEELFQGVVEICDEYEESISIRHLYYRCCAVGLIEKTEKEYNSLRAFLTKWRRSRLIPYGWFIDGTRTYYGRRAFNSLGEYARVAAQGYRLNLWRNSGYYVEIWTEKDAVASAVSAIAEEWNLRTFPCRGDASMSSLAMAASGFNQARDQGQYPVILYFGDYDPTGLAIPDTIERNLKSDHDCPVMLYRLAVNEEQIDLYDLSSRPPKGSARGYQVERAVDIDAMHPSVIRELLQDQVEALIDPDEVARMKEIEASERETLEVVESSIRKGRGE